MVQAAVAGVDGRRGLSHGDRPGRSELHRRHGARAAGRRHRRSGPMSIVGADVAAELDTWQRVDELRAAVTLVVVDRGGVGSGEDRPGGSVERLRIPALDISSSQLRRASGPGPVGGFPHSRARHTLHPPAKSVRWQQMSSADAVRTAAGPHGARPGGLTEVDVAVPAA